MSYIASPAHIKAYALALIILAAAFLHDAAFTRVSSLPPQQEGLDIMESQDPKLEALQGIAYYARERVEDLQTHGLNSPDDQIDLARWSRVLTALETEPVK